MGRWNNPDVLILGSSYLNYAYDLGCLKKFEEDGLLRKIKVIGATGSGIIIGILLATGMDIEKISTLLRDESVDGFGRILDSMLIAGPDEIDEASENLVSLITDYLIDLYGMIPTLQMFFLFTGIDMLFSVYNVTEGKVEQLSRLNKPSFLVTDVIMASLSNLRTQHVEIDEKEYSDPSLASPIIRSFKGRNVISVITVPSIQEDIGNKLTSDMSPTMIFDILCMCSSVLLSNSKKIARIEGYDYIYLRTIYQKGNCIQKELKEIMESKGYEQASKITEPPVTQPTLRVSHNGIHDMMTEGFNTIIDRFHEDYTDLSDKWLRTVLS